MDTTDLSAFVRRIPLFSIYRDEELAELIKLAQLRSVRAGELVFDQGDQGDSFYVVYSGRIRILRKNEAGKEINLGVCSRSDHFGETALITEHPRNAAARVCTQLLCSSASSSISFSIASRFSASVPWVVA